MPYLRKPQTYAEKMQPNMTRKGRGLWSEGITSGEYTVNPGECSVNPSEYTVNPGEYAVNT